MSVERNKKEEALITRDVESLIITMRNQKVIIDRDLAEIYGVETRRLNEQVKRNPERFPEDFMFQLTREEADFWVRSRSQIAILKRGTNVKYLPYAFTEYGAIMAANVLNSRQAVRGRAWGQIFILEFVGTMGSSIKKLAVSLSMKAREVCGAGIYEDISKLLPFR